RGLPALHGHHRRLQPLRRPRRTAAAPRRRHGARQECRRLARLRSVARGLSAPRDLAALLIGRGRRTPAHHGTPSMDHLLPAASASFTPVTVTAILLGSIFGVIFGSIPGLTFTVAMALAVPLTFSLDQGAAIGLMLGTYIGGMTGGSVSSILLGVPGTPSA